MRILPAVLISAALCACESKPDSAMTTGTTTPALGTVDATEGKVELRHDGTLAPAAKGQEVANGDALRTGKDSRARLTLSEGSVLAVGPSSTVELPGYSVKSDRRSGTLKVVAGQFWLRVVELAGVDTEISIETPAAVAGIRGTTVWGDTERDVICALAGSVEVTPKNGSAQMLKPGECLGQLSSDAQKVIPEAKQVGVYLNEVHIGEPLEAK
ncbi:MAG: FecR family protein [Myxococcota bacterium]